MSSLSIHPEHAMFLTTGELRSRVLRRPFHRSFNAELFWFFVLGCLIAFTLVAIAFVWAPQPTTVRSPWSKTGLSGISSAPLSREAFLAKLSDQQLFEVATHTHYIAQLIRGVDSGIDATAKKLALAIVVESIKADFDPLLVAAIVKAESTFQHGAVSSRGAQGLMQLRPETGMYISKQIGMKWRGAVGLKDPQYNVKLGIAYIKYLGKYFHGNLRLTLAAYNWGPGNVINSLKNQGSVPNTTVRYADKILRYHEEWRSELDSRMAAYKFMNLDSMLS